MIREQETLQRAMDAWRASVSPAQRAARSLLVYEASMELKAQSDRLQEALHRGYDWMDAHGDAHPHAEEAYARWSDLLHQYQEMEDQLATVYRDLGQP
jgi:predicted glycoside hydrolase/deacetylase ChbG (UPF0249 family)